MIKTLPLLVLLCMTLSAHAMSKKQSKIDDWDYNATQLISGKKSRIMPTGLIQKNITMPASIAMESSLGFSVGGAKDADNFYENIKHNYLPKIDSITYEGVFYDHQFTSPQTDCEQLFCPAYSTAVVKNPFTGKAESYLSVGLSSNIKPHDFKRKKLNIVVILDISGSMGSPFNQYYYDHNQKISLAKEDLKTSKIELANKAIVQMLDHLHDEDRLGVVLFDNQAYRAKPLRSIKNTDIPAIKKHILALKERGGTNWSAGYREGVALYDTLSSKLKDPKEYENRIIFLTDAMPNRGELNKNGLFDIVQKASSAHIYTTFIGIGVDFNNDLVETVTKTTGANYFAVHSAAAFQKRMDEEFDYMVTPLVFNLKLTLHAPSYSIAAVYGSPDANKTSGACMYVNTLFPSPTDEKGSRGGVILLKLQKLKSQKPLTLTLDYHDREGVLHHSEKTLTFKQGLFHDNTAVLKAVLLSRYVDLIKNYLLDTRKSCHDSVTYAPFALLKKQCTLYPPDRDIYPMIKTWERKSCPLIVSEGYHKLFSLFLRHFKSQEAIIRDHSLNKEFTLLQTLAIHKDTSSKKIDDWQEYNR